MHRVVSVGVQAQAVQVEGQIGAPTLVTLLGSDGAPQKQLTLVSAYWPGDALWQGTVNGRPISVQVRPMLNGHTLAYRGIAATTHVYTAREAELVALMPIKAAADMSKFLLCPMPGLVKALHVKEGADVKAGDPLAVVEAMKMENVLRAERDGIVKSIKTKAGESLAVDAVIMEFA